MTKIGYDPEFDDMDLPVLAMIFLIVGLGLMATGAIWWINTLARIPSAVFNRTSPTVNVRYSDKGEYVNGKFYPLLECKEKPDDKWIIC